MPSVHIQAAPRATLSLDGVWNFATDPDNVGEKEEWFTPGKTLPKMPREGYAPTADGTVKVPGCWDAQGYGTENSGILKHNFIGKGWYKRTFVVPENWKTEKVFLAITGMARYAKVWIDGKLVGPEAVGCVSKHTWDVTDRIVPGKETDLTICVDSKQRFEIDALYGAAQLADYIGIGWHEVAWGGIWGHVLLEGKPKVRLDDPYIRTKYKDGNCRVETSVIKDAADTPCDAVMLEIFENGSDRPVARTTFAIQAETAIAVETKVPDAKLWSPHDPNLYIARLTLLAKDKPVDVVQTRFGIREFQAEGSDLYLNGKKLMLCGYGDDHIYPHDWSLSADKEMYLRRLRLIKSFGFNYVRHHSTTMPPEYYEACDEVGIMPMVEFLIVYQEFMPGEKKWLERVPKETSTEPAFQTYVNRWEAVVKQYRNHPSILCWVLGNELWSEKPLLKRLRIEGKRIAQEYDPDRFFLDSAGIWKDHISKPENDRDTVDLYCCLFDEWSSPILNPKKFDFPKPKKPTISHESGNFITFTRPDEIELYETSNFHPFWMVPGREKLKKLGLLAEANDWAAASDKLYLLHHKYNVESLRRNPKLSGYQWWLIQDFWTTSNGLVDTNFRLKSIRPEDVRPFNGPVVLLQSGLERTCRSDDRFDVKLILSNYSPEALNGTLTWRLAAGDRTLASKNIDSVKAEQGSVISLGSAETTLPEVGTPVEMILSVTLKTAEGSEYVNSWSSWLFPKRIVPDTGEVVVYADEETKSFLPEDSASWSLRSLPNEAPYPADAVYLISWPDAAVIDAMDRGASVVLLGGISNIRSIGVNYQSTWWKGGDSEESNHVGTYVYDHPIVRDIAPERWGNIAWANLIQGATKFHVEDAPVRPEIIVRALPTIVRLQDTSLLYRVGAGKGMLIASGLNHVGAAKRPENAWIIAKILEDAARFKPPKQVWPANYCSSEQSAPEGMVLGYRRAFAKQAEQSVWHSHRKSNERVFICRQDSKNRFLEWDTVAVPQHPDGDRITFIFAGAFGYATQPKTDGFELTVDGKPVLKFDFPDPTEWKSEDGQAVLKFDLRKTIGPDRFGYFTLTLPSSMLKPRYPVRLGVRSLGENSRRWFGLYPIVDITTDYVQ